MLLWFYMMDRFCTISFIVRQQRKEGYRVLRLLEDSVSSLQSRFGRSHSSHCFLEVIQSHYYIRSFLELFFVNASQPFVRYSFVIQHSYNFDRISTVSVLLSILILFHIKQRYLLYLIHITQCTSIFLLIF